MTKIKNVYAREILDSRGNPTVEAEIELESGVVATAAVPSGASTGTYEALELRDGNPQRYGGLGVQKAVANINGPIRGAIIGKDAEGQEEIDKLILELDGTENKSNLGANAILGVSLAVCRAASIANGLPLYKYIAQCYRLPASPELQRGEQATSYKLPIPMFNVINGGKHSDSGLAVQEYKIVPNNIKTFKEQYRAGSEVFHALKKILSGMGENVSVGDEGGFAPHLKSNTEPLELMNQAIEKAGYKPGEDINLGVDVAASGFLNDDGGYDWMPEGRILSADNLIDVYAEWIEKYNVISVEDGLEENDWTGWRKMNEMLGNKTMLIGDDLLVTNVKRVEKAIAEKACNAVLIKVNQIGSLSETVACVKLAHENGYETVMSHRSGETTDDFISDLAVAVGSKYMKSGSLSRGERICKYNRLLRIEEELGME